MNLLGENLAQKVNEKGWEAKTEQHLIYCTESTMKELDEHFVESLLEGVYLFIKANCKDRWSTKAEQN